MPPNTAFNKSEAISPTAKLDPTSLKNKSVIITGGASGIGEATLRAFVQAGAFVTFGDVADDRGEALVAELGSGTVHFVHCDVTKWEDQLNLFKQSLIHSPTKTINFVLANAGINRDDYISLQDASLPNGDPVEPDLGILQTNFIGVMYTAKLALYYFPRQASESSERDQALIITGSIASFADHAGSPQYNASKFGVRGLMRSLRRNGAKEGFRVNLIAPWFTDTRIMPPGAREKIEAAGIEFVEIEDAANAVLHFASDGAINGRSLAIVPRSVSQRGYLDLELDDMREDDFWGIVKTTQHPGRK